MSRLENAGDPPTNTTSRNKATNRTLVRRLARAAQRSAAVATVASDELEDGEVAGNKITFEGEAKFRDNASKVGSLGKGKCPRKTGKLGKLTVIEFLRCLLSYKITIFRPSHQKRFI